tara:strand:- start:5915 stop:6787 length:873 start_codon:yes stop_codon:yes gene_type:complete
MKNIGLNIENLLRKIDKINQISNEEWIEGLEDRKLKELEFHDQDRDKDGEWKLEDNHEKYYGNRKYYSTVHRSQQYIKDWIIKESKDKVFLDYACGEGDYGILAAESGAALSIGLDISPISIENANEKAREKNIPLNQKGGIVFFQGDCENTKLPDNSIDVIICSGMLHHLDRSYAFPELRRILKPGGKILAAEALNYNPAIKLYRMLTPAMRTDFEKEHILSLKDLKFAKHFLDVRDIRYWHVIGYIGGKLPFLFPLLDNIDKILEKIPLIQLMGWQFTFVLQKNDNDS